MKQGYLAGCLNAWLVVAGFGCGDSAEPSAANAGAPAIPSGSGGAPNPPLGGSPAGGAGGLGANAGSSAAGSGGTGGITAGAGASSGAGAGGVGGGSGGMAGSAGTSGGGGSMVSGTGGSAGSSAGCPFAGEGATARFSFFVTSQAGLERLSKSKNGFGGDLRYGEADGLAGADKICRELAEDAYEGAGCKTWRAFLSVTKDASGKPVHAKDRIGDGPWYDRRGRLVAMTKDDLLQPWPRGADPVIALDLPNEFGVPNHDPDGTGNVDNHNTITGSGVGGMLINSDWAYTCHDWTSKVGTDGKPTIGFTWKGGAANLPGSMWYGSDITEGGCADIINITNSMDFSIRGIGALGGYGGFYCLALEP